MTVGNLGEYFFKYNYVYNFWGGLSTDFVFRLVQQSISSPIPYDHSSGPVFPIGDDPLKIPVFQGMVFHLHRQPLFPRVHGGAFGKCPGTEGSLHLQTKIEMETGGMVFVDDEMETHTCLGCRSSVKRSKPKDSRKTF
jgi:hypothetical protein